MLSTKHHIVYISMIPKIVVAQTTLPILTRRGAASNWKAIENRFPVNRIYCIGRNYKAHAIEMGADPRDPPFFFQKPSNSIVDTYGGNGIVTYPPMTSSLHYEGELVVAIGKEGGGNSRGLSVQEVEPYIFGYAVGCDLTRRDLQAEAKKLSRPWASAKGFDGSAPCGPIVPRDQVAIEADTRLALHVNDELRQETTLDHMVWSIPEMLSFLSRYFRLMPGDVIMTGTPAGVGPLHVSDNVTITCGDLPPCKFSVGEPEI